MPLCGGCKNRETCEWVSAMYKYIGSMMDARPLDIDAKFGMEYFTVQFGCKKYINGEGSGNE